MPKDDAHYDSLPTEIVDALRELDGPAVLPDAQHDADVFSGARQHLAPLNRQRRNRRLFIGGGVGGALAAAAMIGIVVMLGPFREDWSDFEVAMDSAEETSIEESAPYIPDTDVAAGDLDANGRVNILDAYTLARRIEQGRANQSFDLDADGNVDQRDIDWIANQAVAIKPGEQG